MRSACARAVRDLCEARGARREALGEARREARRDARGARDNLAILVLTGYAACRMFVCEDESYDNYNYSKFKIAVRTTHMWLLSGVPTRYDACVPTESMSRGRDHLRFTSPPIVPGY